MFKIILIGYKYLVRQFKIVYQGGMGVRKWQKWINTILALILLLTLFVSYFIIFDYGSITDQMRTYGQQEWFYYFLTTITIISGLLGLYLLIRVIVSPSLKNYIIDKDKSGEILITSRALESNVISTLERHPEVRNAQVDVKVKNSGNNAINTKVLCGVYQGDDLNTLGNTIQREVKESLEKFTGYPVNDVNVKFYDIKLDTNKRVV